MVAGSFVETTKTKPTLLVSAVAFDRGEGPQAIALTERLLGQILKEAEPDWDVVMSWAEEDGVDGALQKLDDADAVIIMGGPDIDPVFYGGPTDYPGKENHFPKSDEAQIGLIRSAIKQEKPLLGICRGLQLLNVAQGGTLIQDLGDVPGHDPKDLLSDFKFCQHMVTVDSDSQLAGVLSVCSAGAPSGHDGGLRLLVHSAHHQAVDQLGEDLVVVARADDGTIEALEHVSAPVAAVQWHPEDPDAQPDNLRCLLRRLRSN